MSLNMDQFLKDVENINESYHILVTHLYYLYEYEIVDYSRLTTIATMLVDDCFSFLDKYSAKIKKKAKQSDRIENAKVKQIISDIQKIGKVGQKIKKAVDVYGRVDIVIPHRYVKEGFEDVKEIRGDEFVAAIETEVLDVLDDAFDLIDESEYQEVDIPELPEDDEEFLENFKTLEEG